MKDLKTTNILLLTIVVPLVFYLLKVLFFIFIPLVLAMFISLLFLPLMRWLKKRGIPKVISILVVIGITVGVLKLGGELVQISSNEIIAAAKDGAFFNRAENKILELIVSVESFFGIERLQGENVVQHYLQDNRSFEQFGKSIDFITSTLSMTLMTAFFVILLLSESINFQNILNSTFFSSKFSSIKTFMRIERDIQRFVKVKFVISMFTGIGFSIACILFDVSFPVFWGLFAFVINFVQMIGSVISVVMLTLFAFIELDPSGTLLFFVLTITGVQVLMGGVLEPVFMGKTFSLNVVTVLIMLMLWGYIWNIPGLIMSIPITVFIKIVFEQFPKTKIVADLMSGSKPQISFKFKGKKKQRT